MTLFAVAIFMSGLTAAGPTTWDEQLQIERAQLEREKTSLKAALEAAQIASTTTRTALGNEIEELTRTLTRLRAEVAAENESFAERERVQVGASQISLTTDVVGRVNAWAVSRRIVSAPGVVQGSATPEAAQELFAAINHALVARSKIRADRAPYFDDSGFETERNVVRVGPVGAFVVDGTRAAPVEPLDGTNGWHAVGPASPTVSTPLGTVVPVVLFDPETPHEHAPQASRGLFAWLAAGGLVMYPLFLMGLLAALIASERSLVLFGVQRQWWRATSNPSAAQQVADAGWALLPLRVLAELRGAPPAVVEDQMTEAILRSRTRLRVRLSVLALVAASAPLLGLLGTVTGMIGTFRVITEHGTGDPELLSGGIAQALLTTQLGLAVAIPTLLAHAGLNRWTQRLVSLAELAALEAMHPRADHTSTDGEA